MRDPGDLPRLLARDLADVRWPQPTEIRARGRRRTLRNLAAAPVALLLVLASAWLLVRPSHQDAAPPPGGSDSTTGSLPDGWFGPEALAQPADVGEGYNLDNEHAYAPGEDPSWSFSMELCPAYPALKVEAPHAYTWRRINIVAERVGRGSGGDVFTNLTRYRPDLAEQVMNDARRAVAACAEYSYEGGEASTEERPARTVHRHTILEEGFAGDDSLMARHTYESVDARTGERLTNVQEGTTALIVAVRVADRVEVLETYQADPARLREIAVRAARRL